LEDRAEMRHPLVVGPALLSRAANYLCLICAHLWLKTHF
jgi:hypothetical protein